ncbi:MAG TPA: SDR family NAD(P)-dependent oxidoreductase [Terriglobales bacterium]|nr:SDR family NAD(P)-dependent oxidoreductase [Terriglobales bacterium]
MSKAESSPPLAGQVAVITGAGRGIGRAIALRLDELGAHTVLAGRSRAALEQTAAIIQNHIPSNVHNIQNSGAQIAIRTSIVECDVTDLGSVQSLADHLERTFHRLDILINNAGIGGVGGPLHRLAPDNWDSVMNTNLRGAYYCIRSLAPIMLQTGGGHIVNISSLAGKNALPNGAAYAASKWGLNGLTYSVAEELRAHNIRVSVICPGSTNTDFSPHPGKNDEKMLQATDVAHIVAMLVTQAPQSFASEVVLRPTQKP